MNDLSCLASSLLEVRELKFIFTLFSGPNLGVEIVMPDTALILTAIRVALFVPALSVIWINFTISALIELADELWIASGGLSLCFPVFVLGFIIPVLIVALCVLGLIPFAELIACIVLFLIINFVLLIPDFINDTSASVPEHVVVTILVPDLFIFPEFPLTDLCPLLSLFFGGGGGLLFCAVVFDSLTVKINTFHGA